jgi:membrane-bound inhibitor of C-type lysozyme
MSGNGFGATKFRDDTMQGPVAKLMLGGALFVGGVAMGAAPASAQTFQGYHCADGTRFIVAFYDYDSRAYLQIDGRAVTLAKRLNWSGSRYSGDGVTLTMGRAGVAVKHAKRPITACAVDVRQ